MKKRFKYTFYAFFTGWVLFALLVLIAQYLTNTTLTTIVFFIGVVLCCFGVISVTFLNKDNDFFKNQEEISNLRKELKEKIYKTSILEECLYEKLISKSNLEKEDKENNV